MCDTILLAVWFGELEYRLTQDLARGNDHMVQTEGETNTSSPRSIRHHSSLYDACLHFSTHVPCTCTFTEEHCTTSQSSTSVHLLLVNEDNRMMRRRSALVDVVHRLSLAALLRTCLSFSGQKRYCSFVMKSMCDSVRTTDTLAPKLPRVIVSIDTHRAVRTHQTPHQTPDLSRFCALKTFGQPCRRHGKNKYGSRALSFWRRRHNGIKMAGLLMRVDTVMIMLRSHLTTTKTTTTITTRHRRSSSWEDITKTMRRILFWY